MILLNKFLTCNTHDTYLFGHHHVGITIGQTQFKYLTYYNPLLLFKSARYYPYIIDIQKGKLVSLNYENKNICLDLGLNLGIYSYMTINYICGYSYNDYFIKMVVSNWAEIEEFEDNAIYEL